MPRRVLSAAADCPFLPRDLMARLQQARIEQGAQLAVAASAGQTHPVIGLWSVALREALRHALVVEDIRKIDRWTARYKLATVTWPVEPLDPFFNANTMDDIAEAERLAELDGIASVARMSAAISGTEVPHFAALKAGYDTGLNPALLQRGAGFL